MQVLSSRITLVNLFILSLVFSLSLFSMLLFIAEDKTFCKNTTSDGCILFHKACFDTVPFIRYPVLIAHALYDLFFELYIIMKNPINNTFGDNFLGFLLHNLLCFDSLLRFNFLSFCSIIVFELDDLFMLFAFIKLSLFYCLTISYDS